MLVPFGRMLGVSQRQSGEVLNQLLLLESFGPCFITSTNHLLCLILCNVHSTLQLILCRFHVVAVSSHIKIVSEISLGMSYEHTQRKFYKLAKYFTLKYIFLLWVYFHG